MCLGHTCVAPWLTAPWRQRGIRVYSVYPYPISRGDLLAMHGNDERISITGLEQGTDMSRGCCDKRSG